jgi:MATE family multidrug resistance protein
MNNRLKEIAAFSLPICASNLINILGNLIAVVYVAKLGVNHIAALSLASSLYISLLTIATTTTYATSILIGHVFAKHDFTCKSQVGEIFNTANRACLLVCLPIALVLWHGSTLLLLAGQPLKLTQLTTGYFHFAALALCPLILSMVNSQLCIGIGLPKISFIFSVIRLLLTIFFTYCLVLGKFSFPLLGITGVSVAALIVQIIICLLYYCFFAYSSRFKPFKLGSQLLSIDLNSMIHFYKIGLPIGIQFGGELGALFVNTMMLGYLGVNALVASQVVSQYGLLLIMISLGVSQALSVITSGNYAKGDIEQIKQDTRLGVQLNSMIFFVAGIFILVGYRQMLAVYIDIHDPSNQKLFYLTCILFGINWLSLYIDGLRNLFSGVLRGLQQSHYPMQIGLYCLWLISIPCAYIGGFLLRGGAVGLGLGFLLGFLFASILLWQRLSHANDLNYNEIAL